MIKYIPYIILGLFTFNYSKAEIDCKLHRIYCKIVELKPSIDREFAMELSDLLYKYSKKYETDPLVSVAIAMQESSLVNTNRTSRAIIKMPNNTYDYIDVITDVGLFQFHVNTIENYDLDVNRIKKDLDYAVYHHVKLLKQKMNLCVKLGVAYSVSWSCYHSATPKHRERYVRLVMRYL